LQIYVACVVSVYTFFLSKKNSAKKIMCVKASIHAYQHHIELTSLQSLCHLSTNKLYQQDDEMTSLKLLSVNLVHPNIYSGSGDFSPAVQKGGLSCSPKSISSPFIRSIDSRIFDYNHKCVVYLVFSAHSWCFSS